MANARTESTSAGDDSKHGSPAFLKKFSGSKKYDQPDKYKPSGAVGDSNDDLGSPMQWFGVSAVFAAVAASLFWLGDKVPMRSNPRRRR